MNYYEYWKSSKGNRDEVFNDVFQNLNKPVNILEIGVSRNLDPAVRGSDGWSSLYFANHIKMFGGKLVSVDLDPNAIKNCKILCQELDDDISHDYYVDFGTSILIEKKITYDLIYLDGGDGEDEMLEEYEIIANRRTGTLPLILCDDFHVKGGLLRKKYDKFLLYKWENNPHEMGLYGTQDNGLVKIMKIIENI